MKTARDSNLDAGVRKSAEERREEILEAAIEEFAARGLRGASIESVAERVGVSQPYVYKLFGTKKDLFLAASGRVRERIQEAFREAAEADPENALAAMGHSYDRSLFGRKERLMLLQGFAASHDEDVREAVGEGYAGLWRFVKGISGASDEEVRNFFAMGMLMTVDAAIGLTEKLGKQVGIGDQMGEE
ncbi:MAG TPA: TetR/AcrR family transcriptional regulator [Rubrobacter sp.]|nr:TetR/AcrR family transcriptional regulator [Rubrobacter sp.]